MRIEEYDEARDFDEAVDLFKKTVHTIGKLKYSDAHLHAWAPLNSTYDELRHRLLSSKTFILRDGQQMLGFGTLDTTGCIDMFYVKHDCQGKGVGSRLMKHLLRLAQDIGLKYIYSDVSLTAKEFFVSNGFVVLKEYEKLHNGLVFKNSIMFRLL